MDKDHIRSAWPSHSYENLYFLQERYESVVLSRQMVDQIRAIPTLIHKDEFAYECPSREAIAVRWDVSMGPMMGRDTYQIFGNIRDY